MSEKYYAHTREEFLDPCDWQLLEDHLKNVAELAANFTETFESRSWGWLAGLWHDLGKYQPEFQARLRGEQTRVEHSGLGAAHAFGKNKINGLPLAFVIAGHHAGLANLIGSGQGQPNAIIDRVKSNQKSLKELLSFIPKCLLDKPFPVSPPFISLSADLSQKETKVNLRRCEFWIRFLFSALVDADRLDTEYFVDKQQNRLRGGFETIGRLKEKLDAFLKDKIAGMSPDIRNTQVNKMRAGVLANCLQAAESDPGVFSLTVPTGGGKTLSAMAFALKHAECNGLRRVIVVIPYTSIIEQNAQQYRLALGTENIIEHHSNFDIEAYKKRHGEEDTLRMELATENWDAPVIVTTTVQFFESLFSNKPSQCRKLHNVAGSVIILDEVQTLPPEYLISVLEALNELIEHYGCSVVLSTATPPALAVRKGFEWGLKNVREIVVDADDLACKLGRVDYTWPDPDSPPVTWEALAKELSQYEQVLAVVHRRDDAREVAERLRSLTANKPVFHLSALMCPAHRVDVLAQVKDNLHAGEPCLLVSTQLVEAGVDLDFPVVYRALGGLDSMVQAAGRCNREGRLDRGRVIIFRAPFQAPIRYAEQSNEHCRRHPSQRWRAARCSNPTYF